MFNNSAVYQYFRYCAPKLLLLRIMTYCHNMQDTYIILLFQWKMSKATKKALTRCDDYSDDIAIVTLPCAVQVAW